MKRLALPVATAAMAIVVAACGSSSKNESVATKTAMPATMISGN